MKEAIYKRLHIVWFHLYEISTIGQSIDIESWLVIVWGWRQEQNLTKNMHEGTF